MAVQRAVESERGGEAREYLPCGRQVGGRRQEVDGPIEHRVHTDPPRGGADENGKQLPAEHAETETAADLLLAELAALEVVLEERVVRLRDGLQQPVAMLGGDAVV